MYVNFSPLLCSDSEFVSVPGLDVSRSHKPSDEKLLVETGHFTSLPHHVGGLLDSSANSWARGGRWREREKREGERECHRALTQGNYFHKHGNARTFLFHHYVRMCMTNVLCCHSLSICRGYRTQGWHGDGDGHPIMLVSNEISLFTVWKWKTVQQVHLLWCKAVSDNYSHNVL